MGAEATAVVTDSARGSFTTHANYIRAFAVLAGNQTWPPLTIQQRLQALGQTVMGLVSIGDKPPGAIDLNQVRASLANAWGTELLLGLAGHLGFQDDLVRLTNNWAVVQCYYITYHATQAYSVAKGKARPDSHTKTQKEFASHWIRRPIQAAPWTLGLTQTGFVNIPAGRVLNTDIHPWFACDGHSAWDLAGKALKSTREAWIEEAIRKERRARQSANRKQWQAAEQARVQAGKLPRSEPTISLPRLTPAEKAAVANGVRCSGLIDYFYRLRIKTHYEDSSMFTDGPRDDQISSKVHQDLTYLAAATLLLHELHVGKLVGKATLLGWVDQWLTAHLPDGMPIGLAQRSQTLHATL